MEKSARQTNTDEFVKDYLLHRNLMRTADAELEEYQLTFQPNIQFPDEPELRVGQIRALGQTTDTIYVLIYRQLGGGCWLVIPLSPFDCPASDDELLLSNLRSGMKVLQMWNIRTLHHKFIRQSICMDAISADDLSLVTKVFACYHRGGRLEGFDHRFGIPITDDNDIRLEYMEEQLDKFAELDSLDFNYCVQTNKEEV